MTRERVLVCDDEEDFADFVRQVAEALDHEVMVVTQSAGFKSAYQAFDPTLVVLDIVMPDVDGMELVRWLARQRATARVVIVTGYNPHYADMARVIGEASGLLEVSTLSKPVSLNALRAALAPEPQGRN